MLCACGKNTNVTDIPESLESGYEWNIKKEDMIPMVMVNDVLYLATGYEKETEERPDTFDGEITSEVDRREKPTVNDQSNASPVYSTGEAVSVRKFHLANELAHFSRVRSQPFRYSVSASYHFRLLPWKLRRQISPVHPQVLQCMVSCRYYQLEA